MLDIYRATLQIKKQGLTQSVSVTQKRPARHSLLTHLFPSDRSVIGNMNSNLEQRVLDLYNWSDYASFLLSTFYISMYKTSFLESIRHRNRTIMYFITTAVILRTDFNSPNSYEGTLRQSIIRFFGVTSDRTLF